MASSETFSKQSQWIWKEMKTDTSSCLSNEKCGILQLRNDLKTLANTKTASQLYKYFLRSWLIASSFNLASFSFIPGTWEKTKLEYFSKLGYVHRSILCYQNFSERKGTREKFNTSVWKTNLNPWKTIELDFIQFQK